MNKFYVIMVKVFGLIVRFFGNVRVHGRENEPMGENFILCSNHVGTFDPPILIASLKNQICFMTKRELLKVPIVGWIIRNMGSYSVDRAGNDVSAIKKTLSILDEGKCIGIFPQGTRCPNVNPRDCKIKPGVGFIVSRAKISVLPVFIKKKNAKPGMFRRTDIIIGNPISFEELKYEHGKKGEHERISSFIFDRICSLGEGEIID